MEDLNDLVWSTTTTNSTSTSNGRSRPFASNSNGHNNAGGPNPFSSNSQYSSSPQKPITSFGSYGQKTLNAPKNPLLSSSPRNHPSGNPLSHKTSLNKLSSDPFESLVNLGTSTKKNSTANLSLEEQRKIQLENQKNHTIFPNSGRSSSPANRQFWEQLDSKSPSVAPKSVPLTPSRSFSPSIGSMSPVSNRQQKPTIVDPFDELLGPTLTAGNSSSMIPPKRGPPIGSKPVVTKSSSPAVDPWNLDFLEQGSNKAKSPSASLIDDDPFGLGAFTGPSSMSSTSSKVDRPALPKRNSNPLGILASPAPPKIVQTEESSDSEESMDESRSFNNRNGCSSPVDPELDHLIAQVMEMGFGYEQARSALELSGNDFQSAIDILVDNRNAEDKITYHKQKNTPPLPRRSHRSRNSSDEENYNQETPAWRSEKSQYTSPWSSGRRRESEETSGFDMASFQVRKEKFMSNASTIGASVLSKANLFVKQASEKIRESIDDIQQRSENSQKEDDRFKKSGRPRWLQRHSDDDSSDEDRGRGSYSEYKDEYVGRRPFSSPKQEKPPVESYNGVHRVQSQDSLRNHRAPPRPPVSLKNRVPHKPPVSPKPPVASQPTRPPRSIVSATPEQLQLSEKQKAAGTDKFKLGQFGDAEELYSQAISTLPPKHDNLILLYNNRAAARIKVGDYNGVISDCDKIVELIRDEYLYPSSNDPFSFKDQLIKAITRRASAYESKEKYETAEKDFSKILSIDSNNRTGLEGVRRCQKAIKMVHGETTSKSSIPSTVLETTKGADLFSFQQPNATTAQAYSPTFGAHLDEFGFATVPSPAVHTSKTSKADIDKSEGVSRLRAQDRLAEQEEEEKLRILDMVEERLNQWKSNKVGNLRAMIASLDTILWPELNWKACGLQDLIQPNQVKSKYIRAIAKLHPDKLSTNESVEHKLLASGLFSILNESWDQFKAQNGL